MRILISGGGELGRMIAESLIKAGHTVVIIESREECCKDLAEELNAIVVHGDATHPNVLEKGEIANSDVVITATNSDQDNLITAIVAREYGVKRIVVKFNDPSFDPVCLKLGINEIINPKVVAAHQMADLAREVHLVNVSPIIRGDARVFTTSIQKPEHVNQHIASLDLPKTSIIVAIYRKEEFLIPRGDIKLRQGDTITLICDEATLETLQKFFSQTN
jgi:trk system potassium uptake protein TrkA